MHTTQLIAQWIIGLGILNVWLLRPRLATAYRGGDAGTMQEEFAVYGLPVWFMYAIGAVKVALALALMAGTWFPVLVQPSAVVMAGLMTGAVVMHLKVRDSFKKTSPSLAMLALSLLVVIA
jgi:hypothetical protein